MKLDRQEQLLYEKNFNLLSLLAQFLAQRTKKERTFAYLSKIQVKLKIK